MSSQDKSGREASASAVEKNDSAYGGCRYRLTYDKYEGAASAKEPRKPRRPLSILIAVVVFFVFVASGFFIMRYYDTKVSRIISGSGASAKTVVNFQSYSDTEANDD